MAFRSLASNETVNTSLVITKPSGTANGDILVGMVITDNASNTFTWPSGFTEVTGTPITCTADNQTLGVAIKVAGGSEPANYTITCAAEMIGLIAAFSGCVTTGVPHRVSTGDDDTADASPWNIVTGTFTGGNTSVSCDIVFIGGSDINAAADATHTAPSGFTLPTGGDIDAAGGFQNGMIAYKENAASGETGAYTATGTSAGNSAGDGCVALALELSGGGGGRTTKNTRAFPLGVEAGMDWRGTI